MIKCKDKKDSVAKKSQSAIEYALLIATVAAALIAFNIYINQASQGRIKKAADGYSGGMQYQE